MSKSKSDKPPKSTRQYEKRLKATLRKLRDNKQLENPTHWDMEILNSCVEKGLVTNIKLTRNMNGNMVGQYSGSARLTLEGYAFLDRMSADQKSNIALWISVISAIVSAIGVLASFNFG